MIKMSNDNVKITLTFIGSSIFMIAITLLLKLAVCNHIARTIIGYICLFVLVAFMAISTALDIINGKGWKWVSKKKRSHVSTYNKSKKK